MKPTRRVWLSLLAALLLVAAFTDVSPGAAPTDRTSNAVIASAVALGAHQTPCPRNATNCCPGANCNAHPALVNESPLLVETAIGSETVSPHLIHAGQHFTITFHPAVTDAKGWTFPDIARKVSRCGAGLDLTCRYLARPSDVTFPEFATFNGWTDYSFSVGNSRGVGVGFDYFAIVGNKLAVTGRLADKHGHAIPAGGIMTLPGQPTPDAGVLIFFYVKRHGALTLLTDVGPRMHSSRAHPYDVGYYGLTLKRGTYVVKAGDPVEHVTCKPRTLHLTTSISNFNFLCKRG